MTSVADSGSGATIAFLDDDSRWKAVVDRLPEADGAFVYSVKTTGVYCRPTCSSRRALRENVAFHATNREAEAAGFRPCKRCRPTGESLARRHAEVVSLACRVIEESDAIPSLDDLADSVGVSRYHFHRLFKAQTGLTPRAYAASHRMRRVRDELGHRESVTAAIHGAGFSSNSRFYEKSTEALGMTPRAFRSGGVGATIRFAVGESGLGSILVAASDKGVCAIFLGDDPDALARNLQDRFPRANLIGGDAAFEQLVARVVGYLEASSRGFDLPLDIRGTAFQQRVWDALRRIPPGATATYAEIADRIGQPKATRAVARACGANPIAVVIPCHRVIRADGSISGYRWGVERKITLLRLERDADRRGVEPGEEHS